MRMAISRGVPVLRSLGTAALAATLLVSAGCVVVTGSRTYSSAYPTERYFVSEEGMTDVINANKRVRLGMSRDEAMANYEDRMATLMSSADIEGVYVEWRVQAYEGTRKHVKSRFIRWLYFSDDELVRMSPDRIDLWNIPEEYDDGMDEIEG